MVSDTANISLRLFLLQLLIQFLTWAHELTFHKHPIAMTFGKVYDTHIETYPLSNCGRSGEP